MSPPAAQLWRGRRPRRATDRPRPLACKAARLPPSSLHMRRAHQPLPELGSPGRGFIGTEGSGYLCSSPPAALTSPVRIRRSAMQSALPLWPLQMPPLCWGPRPRSTGAWVGVGRRPQRTSPAVSSWTVAPRTTYTCNTALDLFGRGCQPWALLTPSRQARGRPAQCSVLVQSLSHVWLYSTPWTAAHQASLSITIFRSLFKLMSIESVMLSNYLIICCPLLLLSIFPSIRV